MLKRNVFFILVTMIIVSSFISAIEITPSIESQTGSTYYTDSTDFNLVFDMTGVSTGSTYNFSLTNYEELEDIFNSTGICTYNEGYDECVGSRWSYNIIADNAHLVLKFKLETKDSAYTRTETDNFEFLLNDTDCGITPECYVIDDFIVTPEDGRPSFSVRFSDREDNDNLQFSKNEQVTVYIENLEDNEDDIAGDVVCSLKEGGVQIASKIYYEDSNAVLTTINKETFGSIGEYELEVICNDGHIEKTNNYNLEFVDMPPIIDISITPSEPKPGSTLTCNASYEDIDDPDTEYTISYAWKKNGTNLTNTTDTYSCSDCKTGDKIECIASIESESISATKETTISSYYSSASINTPDTIQVGQEVDFTHSIVYSGSGTTKYLWNFGDSETSSNSEPTHTYDTKGNFTVTLELDDEEGSTYKATKEIDVVDAGVNIRIDKPVTNESIKRGSKIDVQAYVTDKAGNIVDNANVYAKIRGQDKTYITTKLEKNSTGGGIYVGKITAPFLAPENSKLVIDANYSHAGVTKSGSAAKDIVLKPEIFNPKFILDTKFNSSEEDKLTEANVIDKLTICLKLGEYTYSDSLDEIKIKIESSYLDEFTLKEDNSCYSANISYPVPTDVKSISISFVGVVDNFGNYIRDSYKKVYTIEKLPEIFNLTLKSPVSDKVNEGQSVPVDVEFSLIENKEIDDINGYIKYKGNTYLLEFEDNHFTGSFKPDNDSTITFRVIVEATIDGVYSAKEIRRDLTKTDKLDISFISPNMNGIIDTTDELIIDIRNADGTYYNSESIEVIVNDTNYIFNKIKSGKFANYYATDYSVDPLESVIFSVSLYDEYGNNFSDSFKMPTLSYKFPLYTYIIFIVLLLLGIGIGVYLYIISKRQTALMVSSKEKSAEDIEDEIEMYHGILSDMKRKLFKRQISEDEFRKNKLEYEQKITQLEAKLRTSTPQDESETTEKLVNFFKKNNWSEEKIREYLEKQGVQDKLIKYIIKRTLE